MNEHRDEDLDELAGSFFDGLLDARAFVLRVIGAFERQEGRELGSVEMHVEARPPELDQRLVARGAGVQIIRVDAPTLELPKRTVTRPAPTSTSRRSWFHCSPCLTPEPSAYAMSGSLRSSRSARPGRCSRRSQCSARRSRPRGVGARAP